MQAILLLLLCVCTLTLGYQSNYFSQFDGYKVIRANITNEQQINTIKSRSMDVWSGDSWPIIGTNDIMVTKDDVDSLELSHFEVILDNVEAALRREVTENNAAKSAEDWFTSYHTYDEIIQFVSQLASSFPALIKYEASVGKSIQGRNIPLLTIAGGKNANKKKLFLLGGQHSREWIGPATVLYITNKLVTEYGKDKKVTDLVDNFDFVVAPMMNPDGYVWTWTSYRLWRKNRRVNSDRTYGVDLNRNWGNHWCENGASKVPSSDTYCGTGPFSEPESQTISSIAKSRGPFGGAIDFHSYGQLIMRPYGWTSSPPNNNDQLYEVGEGMKEAMIAATGTKYTNQAIWQLYLSSGSSCDYFHDEAGIPLSFGFEARDTGRYGFELPPAQIKPSGEENFAALAYLASQVA